MDKGVGLRLRWQPGRLYFAQKHNRAHRIGLHIGWVNISILTQSPLIFEWETNDCVRVFSEGQDEIPEVKTVVHGIIMGMEMPFPLPNPDACKDSGITCPLKKDQNYEYIASLPVMRAYPKVMANERLRFLCEVILSWGLFFMQVRVDVKWELQTAQGEKILCLLIPAKIE